MQLISDFAVFRVEMVSGKLKYVISNSAKDSDFKNYLKEKNHLTKVDVVEDEIYEFKKNGKISTDAVESFDLETKSAKVEMVNNFNE